jgi:hypothetical protein
MGVFRKQGVCWIDYYADGHRKPEGVLPRQAPPGDHAGLNYDQVDFKAGMIRLKSSETKTDKRRLIPLNQTLTSALKTATRYVRCPWVFVSQTMVDLWQADPE